MISGVLILTGCDRSASPDAASTSKEATPQATPSYIDKADLSALKKHSALRLIAPRFDGAEALPREGIPVEEYQRIAEQFVIAQGLKVEWVFVDAFAELIPTLMAGKGDVIITNMTATRKRQEQVAFTRAINQVDEVLVGKAERDLSDLAKLDGIQLSVLEDSSFVESLQRHNKKADKAIDFTTVPSSNSNADLLSQINEGLIQATVLDSNMAKILIADFPGLKIGARLRKNRPIAWAVRKDNPELLQALNEYLVSHYLSFSPAPNQHRDWAAISKHGRIRLLTTNSPSTYFMWRGDVVGFDYDLAKRFAKQHKLRLSVVLKDSIPELLSALNNGEGDFIAASLTRTPEREALGLSFSRPYLTVTEQLLGRADGPAVTSAEELTGMQIGVNPVTSFYSQLKTLQAQGVALAIAEYPGATTETMFTALRNKEFDFTIADSHLVAIEMAHSDDLKVNLDLREKSGLSYVVRNDQPELLKQLNAFVKKEYRGLFYNVTVDKYFVNERQMTSLQADRIMSGSDLSPYDDIAKTVANKFSMDWRLIVAQMYQESRFNPKAKSFAGARGLMQVIPRTARELGYQDLHDPEQGLEAGVAYLSWLEGRFPGSIDFQERIYFQLAAYNAGAGHVNDARRLARQLKLDPNKWFNNVERAMLLLSKRQYYQKARFGFVRGSEPVNYVRAIRNRYLSYLAVDK